MSLDGKLLTSHGEAFGKPDFVKSKIEEAFPSTTFTLVENSPATTFPSNLQGLAMRMLMGLSKGLSVPSPRWEGHFDDERFAAVFSFGANTPVKKVAVTLYGRKSTSANTYFDILYQNTGWKVHFL